VTGALLIAALIVAGAALAGIITFDVRRSAERQEDADTVDEFHVMTYCPGCGDRHRTGFMGWTEDGLYRCMICCGCPIPAATHETEDV
jgi:hypothetical protein